MIVIVCYIVHTLFSSSVFYGDVNNMLPDFILRRIRKIQCFLMFVSVPRSFLPALEMICEVDRERCQPKFAFTNLEMLPCGCPTVAEESSCTISCKLALVLFFILFCFYLLTCCLQVRFLLVKSLEFLIFKSKLEFKTKLHGSQLKFFSVCFPYFNAFYSIILTLQSFLIF